MTFPAVCRRDHAELERRLAWTRRSATMFASMPTDALAEMLRQSFNMFIGTPEELVAQIG